MGVYGEGRTGVTKLMKNKASSELTAAKWIPKSHNEALSKETEREICNHRRLQHPHIIGLLAFLSWNIYDSQSKL